MTTPEREPLTTVEHRIRGRARTLLGRRRGWPVEALVFVVKQGWAAVYGGLLLVLLLLSRLYPDDLPVSRNDALVAVALLIQLGMLLAGLESVRELRVVLLFHLVGTVMEVFKTSVGSWSYPDGGVLRAGEVPLWSGFMYAAVGSYMVRVHRLFDLRFTRWPPLPLTALVAAGGYVNFFTHHWLPDARWLLIGAAALVWGRSELHARVRDRGVRMPVLVSFVLVAGVVWAAENVATFAGAWLYPHQESAWEVVHAGKITSWFLLMTISVVLVTWVYPPREPATSAAVAQPRPSSSRR